VQKATDDWNNYEEYEEDEYWNDPAREEEPEDLRPPDIEADWAAKNLPPARSPSHRKKLHLSVQIPQGESSSIGKPFQGRLENGVFLPKKGLGWTRFSKDKFAYGTEETVRALVMAFAEIAERYPGSVAVTVGKLSRNRGGPVRPHKSHQSGRDVDVGYFVQENGNQRRFAATQANTLDPEKTWALLEALMRYGRVRYVFVDYRLQKSLKEAAEDAGWREEILNEVFQYPRGKRAHAGIFRHSPGHHNHFHIRFSCAPNDTACID